MTASGESPFDELLEGAFEFAAAQRVGALAQVLDHRAPSGAP